MKLSDEVADHADPDEHLLEFTPMSSSAYRREELLALGNRGLPERGELCARCQVRIPVFADLDAEEERRIRALGELKAVFEVRRATGCSHTFAKIWAFHPDGPQEPRIRTRGPALRPMKLANCPECGGELGRGATRCFKCDWTLPRGRFVSHG